MFHLVFRQNGTAKDDVIRDVAIGNEGAVFLAGDTNGNWSGVTAGDRDFAVCKLTPNGTEIWRWQVNSYRQYSRWMHDKRSNDEDIDRAAYVRHYRKTIKCRLYLDEVFVNSVMHTNWCLVFVFSTMKQTFR